MGVRPEAQLPTYHLRFLGSPELSKQLMLFPEGGPRMGHVGTSLLRVHPLPAVMEGMEASPNAPAAARPQQLSKSSLPHYIEGERARVVWMWIPGEIRMLQVLPGSGRDAEHLGLGTNSGSCVSPQGRELSLIYIYKNIK